MGPKRQLVAKDLIFDIRSGMTGSQIMKKYKLSDRGLMSALKKLIDTQGISSAELYERFPLFDDAISMEEMRKIARAPINVPVTIHDPARPDLMGRVKDISEKGVGAQGLSVMVGDTRTLVIDGTEQLGVEVFSFNAQCRWVKKGISGEYSAGFEITNISQKHLQRLKNLLEELRSMEL